MTAGPREHYRLAPSSSNRWIACPFSAQLDLPQFTNAAAEAGTKAHEWGAMVLNRQTDLDSVPDEFSRGVRMYVDHVLENGCNNPLIEYKWESLSIDEHGGTLDCLLVKDGKACIYDYKHGKYDVKAKDNSQLLCYAAIVAEHFDVKEFFGVIVQPNSSCKQKIKVAEYSVEQVAEHHEKVARAAASDEKCVGQHCFFCPLRRADKCAEGVAYGVEKNWTYK